MCRDIAHGARRCARAEPLPGSPGAAAERAVIRAEAVAGQARDVFADEAGAALDRLFSAVTEATTPAGRTDAVHAFLDSLAGVWHAVVRAIEQAHERRVDAADARFAAYLAGELAQVRAERYAEERTALDRLHAAELHLAEEELLSRAPDWGDELWRECQLADLEDLRQELDAERMRLRKLEARQARRPDPRVASEIRRGAARADCWSRTLIGQRSTLSATPHTKGEGERRCAEARAAVETARAALRAMSGAPGRGLTGDERAYLTHPGLAAAVEHSRKHPEQRRARLVAG